MHYAEDAGIQIAELVAMLERGMTLSHVTEHVLERIQHKQETDYNVAGA
jgi:hypothetical protein